MFLKQMTLGLTRRTPILWFQLTDWPRQAKDINIAWSLGVLQFGCFLVPNCFVSLPFGLIFAPLGASSLFPPFAAAVVRGDSQRHSWSNLKITFGSMLIIDCWIIFFTLFWLWWFSYCQSGMRWNILESNCLRDLKFWFPIFVSQIRAWAHSPEIFDNCRQAWNPISKILHFYGNDSNDKYIDFDNNISIVRSCSCPELSLN